MHDPAASPLQSHQHQAAKFAHQSPVNCAVLTISDTRTPETDVGGKLIAQLLERAGHRAASTAIVRDEPSQIEYQLRAWLNDSNIQAILTTGGTGIGRRDSTIEVVRQLLTAELDGFGELFRMLSFQNVGGAAMLSRAVGGMVQHADSERVTFLFAMPGSPNAIEVAMNNLIAPQLAHLVWERKR